MRYATGVFLVLAACAFGLVYGGPDWQPSPDLWYAVPLLNSYVRNNFFEEGQPVVFSYYWHEYATPEQRALSFVSYEVYDYWGKVVDAGPCAINENITLRLTQPGWYRFVVYSNENNAIWRNTGHGTNIVIHRKDDRLPPNVGPAFGYSKDYTFRGAAVLGADRFEVVLGNGGDMNGWIEGVRQYTQLYVDASSDPLRPRPRLIAFSDGTGNTSLVCEVARQFSDPRYITYFEPRNEPEGTPVEWFLEHELIPFYNTVKECSNGVGLVMGPGLVSSNERAAYWLHSFFQLGGRKYLDAFSFHAYNMVNSDLIMGRWSLDFLTGILAQYNASDLPLWQTEQGNFPTIAGLSMPRNQGRAQMFSILLFEQYGIPKEQYNTWYDRSHGFWGFSAWTQDGDGTLNPTGALMRVWSEEVFGTKFARRLHFGSLGDKLFLGSVFTGPSKSLVALISGGSTDGSVTLVVPGARELRVTSAFGIVSSLTGTDGRFVIAVPEIPVYVTLTNEQAALLQVEPINWGPNFALEYGVTATADSSPTDVIRNGYLENWYYYQGPSLKGLLQPVSELPVEVDLSFAVPKPVQGVAIFAHNPWQEYGTLLDYELQYLTGSGTYETLERVQENAITLSNYYFPQRSSAQTFWSQRAHFIHDLKSPVTTKGIRLLVRRVSYGGAADSVAYQNGEIGQGGPLVLSLREVEVYPPHPTPTQQFLLRARITDADGQPVSGVEVTLAGGPPVITHAGMVPRTSMLSASTDSSGVVVFSHLANAPYTLRPSGSYSFQPPFLTFSGVIDDLQVDFTASPGSSSDSFKDSYTAPLVGFSSPTYGSTFTQGQEVELAAETVDPTSANPITSIAFFDGDHLLGSVSSAPYRLAWTVPDAGRHVLYAVASSANGAKGFAYPVVVNPDANQQAPPPPADPSPLDSICLESSENEPIELVCAPGTVVNVLKAYWGHDGSCPGVPDASWCKSPTTFGLLQARCNGKSSCLYMAANEIFGDPCFSAPKSLIVSYNCTASLPPTPSADPTTQSPGTESPVTESPVTESPVTESPVTESPVTESPSPDPTTEAPATEFPATESPAPTFTNNPSPPENCVSAKEGQSFALYCTSGTIAVTRASYGTGSSCPRATAACSSPTALSVVKKSCNGRKVCFVHASNAEFGDDCPGTNDMAVSYTCVSLASRAEESSRSRSRSSGHPTTAVIIIICAAALLAAVLLGIVAYVLLRVRAAKLAKDRSYSLVNE